MRKFIIITILWWFTCSHYNYVYDYIEFSAFTVGMQNENPDSTYNKFDDSIASKTYGTQQINLNKTDIQPYLDNGNILMSISYNISLNWEKSSTPTCSDTYYFVLKVYHNGKLLNLDRLHGDLINHVLKAYDSSIDNEVFAVSDYAVYFFPNFNDKSYNAPEIHDYKFEFYECEGECAFNDYSKITEKVGEFTVNINYAP